MAALALQYAPVGGVRSLQDRDRERHIPKMQQVTRNIVTQVKETTERTDLLDVGDLQGTQNEPIIPTSDRKVQSLEKAMAYMRKQHKDLVTGLQEEVEKLKDENRDLKLQLVMLQEGGAAQLESTAGARKDTQGSASSRKSKGQKTVSFPEVSKDKETPRTITQKSIVPATLPTPSKAQTKPEYEDVVVLDTESVVDGSEYSGISQQELRDINEVFIVPTNGQYYTVHHGDADGGDHGVPQIFVKSDESESWRHASLAECKQCIEYLHSLIVKSQSADDAEVRVSDHVAAKASTHTSGNVRQLSRPKLKPAVASASQLFVVNGRGVNPLAEADAENEEQERPPSAPLRLGNKSSLPPLVQRVGNRSVQMLKKIKSRHLEHELNFRMQNLPEK